MRELDIPDQELSALADETLSFRQALLVPSGRTSGLPRHKRRGDREALLASVGREGRGRGILADFQQIADHSRPSGARFFGYVVGSGEPVGALGEWLAAVLNQNVTSWRSAPAATTIERTVVGWLADAVGCPGFIGSLCGGGSAANLMALAMAREAKLPANETGAGPAWCTPPSRRTCPSQGDRAAGHRPAESAADPRRRRLPDADGRAQGCHRRGPQGGPYPHRHRGDSRHGGYRRDRSAARDCGRRPEGGAVAACRRRLRGPCGPGRTRTFRRLGIGGLAVARCTQVAVSAASIAAACSIAIQRLRARPSRTAATMSGSSTEDPVEAFAFFEELMELSRRFRALKLWMSLQYHGRRAFREAIARDLRHARCWRRPSQAQPELELLAPVASQRGLLPPSYEGQRGDPAARGCARPGVSVECNDRWPVRAARVFRQSPDDSGGRERIVA